MTTNPIDEMVILWDRDAFLRTRKDFHEKTAPGGALGDFEADWIANHKHPEEAKVLSLQQNLLLEALHETVVRVTGTEEYRVAAIIDVALSFFASMTSGMSLVELQAFQEKTDKMMKQLFSVMMLTALVEHHLTPTRIVHSSSLATSPKKGVI